MTSFQGANLLAKICKQKNNGVAFCFLPRAATQALVTHLVTTLFYDLIVHYIMRDLLRSLEDGNLTSLNLSGGNI